MANINTNIRFYQPNDPYYWEVDNLPLQDLLDNDITLETRISELESAFSEIGLGSKGSFSTEALSDLKAYSEPVTGIPSRFGRVFVRPGRFIARMQLPATRENGFRMMRDDTRVFNNENFDAPGTGGLSTTTNPEVIFSRASRGVARTSVVEFYPNTDLSDKSVVIESFDTTEFNGGAAPSERLDLIYIKAGKSLDTDGDSTSTPTSLRQNNLSYARIGVVKGAYFRTDPAGGTQTNGARFVDTFERLNGRITGMSNGELPTETKLPGFGSVPMPDDLVNYAWHKTSVSEGLQDFLEKQINYQAGFAIPVAYVRVPNGFVTGDAIPPENIIDIRPFLRTAELTYNERAAIAASINPAGSNPFVTQIELVGAQQPLENNLRILSNQVISNTGSIETIQSRISANDISMERLRADVSGTSSAPTESGLNHEGRIAALENSVGGGIRIPIERFKFLNPSYTVFENNKASELGTLNSPRLINITNAIPSNERANIVGVQFRVTSRGSGTPINSESYFNIRGGSQPFRPVSMWGPGQSMGAINTFVADVTKTRSGNSVTLSIESFGTGGNEVNHSLFIDGYIVKEYAQ